MSSPVERHATNWYAIWTRSRHEQTVRDQLVKKEFEVFLPTFARWSTWQDRRKRIEWPLFPGYCFARFDGVNTLPILKCSGVVRIVSFNNVPAPVHDEEIDNLRRLVAQDYKYDPCPLIHEDDLVEIVNGPLRGVNGRLLEKNARHASVILSVALLRQGVRVQVDAADVQRSPVPRLTYGVRTQDIETC